MTTCYATVEIKLKKRIGHVSCPFLLNLNIFLAVESSRKVSCNRFSLLHHKRLNQVVFLRHHLLEILIQFTLLEQVLSLDPLLSKLIDPFGQVGNLYSLFRDHLLLT
jgi:hypothetical protein